MTSDDVLHLDVHDFLNADRPEDLHDQCKDRHLDAHWIGPERGDIIRLDVQHDQEEDERQGDEDHAAEAAFRR
jgi:hypothetical protein